MIGRYCNSLFSEETYESPNLSFAEARCPRRHSFRRKSLADTARYGRVVYTVQVTWPNERWALASLQLGTVTGGTKGCKCRRRSGTRCSKGLSVRAIYSQHT